MFLTLGKDQAQVDDCLAGEIGLTGAEGATAPETLRHKNRKVTTLWREALTRPPTG
jgi:hypothetical protein